MKILDAHCHIYPEKIAERALEGIRQFYDISLGTKGTVDDLLEKGKANGVSHFLCHSVATVPYQVHSINTFISESAAAHPGEITGFGSLHPDSENMDADIEELLSLGLKGVKLHPDFQSFEMDGKKSLEMCGKIRDAGLPILVHLGDPRHDFSNPERTRHFLELLPDIKMIGAHLGGWSMWEEAVEKLAPMKNLVVDCSSSMYYSDSKKVTEYIKAYGVERVFFGSDYPMWPIEEELKRFDKLELTNEEKEMILWNNAAEYLGVKD